jgi:hypothetical protein
VCVCLCVLLAVAPATPTAASSSNVPSLKSDICCSKNFHVKGIYDKYYIFIFNVGRVLFFSSSSEKVGLIGICNHLLRIILCFIFLKILYSTSGIESHDEI